MALVVDHVTRNFGDHLEDAPQVEACILDAHAVLRDEGVEVEVRVLALHLGHVELVELSTKLPHPTEVLVAHAFTIILRSMAGAGAGNE